MRCPKCKTATPAEALCCPNCKSKTPRGRLQEEFEPTSDLRQKFQDILADHKPTVKHIPAWLSWSLILLTLGVCILGSYLSFRYFNQPEPTNVPLHQIALDKLRAKISTQPWMTVDEALENEVEKSRKAGRLKEAEGWDVRPAEDVGFIVSFTFQETGKKQYFIWKVDPLSETYSAQNDAAETIFKP
ncbi:MAG: hypothetical protein HY231_26440 [Acidobacteria bacterium]|nr:hypothetical protein [Acidobacteriota bacterium]